MHSPENPPSLPLRTCLRDPIPEIALAASLLDEAVTAHLGGNSREAEALIRKADMPELREWTESLWGAKSPYVIHRDVPGAPPYLPKDQRIKVRMPNTAEKALLHQRDGFHCRFCGIPVIRKEVRERIRKHYPSALSWGSKNIEQHGAFQLMWLQYDHLLPHARGGNNSLENVLITCAPCNYGRWHYTFQELELSDPRSRQVTRSEWEGLERYK